jgi:hypothetical protein
MSNRLALWMLAAAALGSSGCTLIARGAWNVCDEFANSLDECRETGEYRSWAKASWERIKRCPPGAVYSEDYACGFKDGFVAYVWHGGSGEPPPLPPPCYRKARYRTPEGYRAIEQWFAGYRHGAAVAREQGYRRLVTGPSSLPPPPAPGPQGPPPPPGPVPQALPAPAEVAPREELPPPRTAPAPPTSEALPPPTAGPDTGSDQTRPDPNADPGLSPPPSGPALVPGYLATVPFEVQPAPEESEQAEAPPAPGDLVPVPFEVQPAPEGGAEADHSTENPEG